MSTEDRPPLRHPTRFYRRHIGPGKGEREEMLAFLGMESLDALADQAIPPHIRLEKELDLPPARGEFQLIEELRDVAYEN